MSFSNSKTEVPAQIPTKRNNKAPEAKKHYKNSASSNYVFLKFKLRGCTDACFLVICYLTWVFSTLGSWKWPPGRQEAKSSKIRTKFKQKLNSFFLFFFVEFQTASARVFSMHLFGKRIRRVFSIKLMIFVCFLETSIDNCGFSRGICWYLCVFSTELLIPVCFLNASIDNCVFSRHSYW